jgi:hypothetical protein
MPHVVMPGDFVLALGFAFLRQHLVENTWKIVSMDVQSGRIWNKFSWEINACPVGGV